MEPKTVTVAPSQSHEECLTLAADQSLLYSFKSSQPLDFNIHYHQGDAVTYPVQQKAVSRSFNGFSAPLEQTYCLMWINRSSAPATLNYSLQVPGG